MYTYYTYIYIYIHIHIHCLPDNAGAVCQLAPNNMPGNMSGVRSSYRAPPQRKPPPPPPPPKHSPKHTWGWLKQKKTEQTAGFGTHVSTYRSGNPFWNSSFLSHSHLNQRKFDCAVAQKSGTRVYEPLGSGLLKRSPCCNHLKDGFFKGKPPFPRQCSGVYCKDPNGWKERAYNLRNPAFFFLSHTHLLRCGKGGLSPKHTLQTKIPGSSKSQLKNGRLQNCNPTSWLVTSLSRSPSSALLPFLFWGRVPLLKSTSVKNRFPYSHLTGGPRFCINV